MSKLRLTFACGPYDRTQALRDGTIQVDGVDLNYITMQPAEIFWRQLQYQEFGASEMSLSNYTTLVAGGKSPFIAIPVYPSRVFRHGYFFVNADKGIKSGADLKGKRGGVPEYSMTAAVYMRGLMQHEFGVNFEKIHWVQGAVNKAGAHGKPTVLPLLKPMPIEIDPSGRSLSDLIEDRVVDATLGTSLPESIRTNPDVARLFPNYVEMEREYYKRTGIYPIMHLVAIKRDIYERYPYVATSLYDAFIESKKIAMKHMFNLRALRYMTPFLMRDIDEIYEVFNGDPWPYGVEKNRKTLEALVTYLVGQHLIAAPVKVDDLFVPTYG